jgi:hypothetical protein
MSGVGEAELKEFREAWNPRTPFLNDEFEVGKGLRNSQEWLTPFAMS